MVKFANKLKIVEKHLQSWNRTIFRKVDQRVRLAEDKVFQLEVAYDSDPSESNKISLCRAKKELDSMLQLKEQYWREKVNIKWVKEGDLNTKIFSPLRLKKKTKFFIH